MRYKILIIGKHSFVANNLSALLKKKFIIKKINFDDFSKKDENYLNKYRYLINCSINRKYILKKYNQRYDFDYLISKKIEDLKCKFILLSTRKVYSKGNNIKENSTLNPKCNYSRNKLITENKLKNILTNKLLILRISNIIGIDQIKDKKRKIHKTFIDYFFLNIKKGLLINNKEIYKDFLSTKQFAIIIEKLIKINAYGTYNVSLGKKVFLDNLIKNLNFYNKKKFKTINPQLHYNNDCFYLNNDKLSKKINIKLKLKDLQMDCKEISKIYFNNEK
jgi:dTDP-4-dehydrorhamnose reductase